MMSLMLFASALLSIVLLQACETPAPKYSRAEFLALESNQALQNACNDAVTGDERADELAARDQICSCMQSQSGEQLTPEFIAHACDTRGDFALWEDFIFNKFKRRWSREFLFKDKGDKKKCLSGLTYVNVQKFYQSLKSLCENQKIDQFARYAIYPNPPHEKGSCWEITGMTADGCFFAEACPGNISDLKFLPLYPAKEGVPEGKVKLCSGTIQGIHRVPNPTATRKAVFADPFALALSANESLTYIAPREASRSGVAEILSDHGGLGQRTLVANPKDLKPGCVLSREDRSVMIVLQSDQFCFAYEAGSMASAPEVHAAPCANFWADYRGKWCPGSSLTYDGKRILEH